MTPRIIAQSGKRITIEECKHDWTRDAPPWVNLHTRVITITCNCCGGSGEHNTGSGPGREDYQCQACHGYGHFKVTYGDGGAVTD